MYSWIKTLYRMQQSFYSGVDRYYEVFCGKGDTVELERGPVVNLFISYDTGKCSNINSRLLYHI